MKINYKFQIKYEKNNNKKLTLAMYYGSVFVNTNVPENNLQLKTTWTKDDINYVIYDEIN